MDCEIEVPAYLEDPGEPTFFTEFMASYPKQENRDGALKEWWRIRPALDLHAKIMRAVRILEQSDKWLKGYAPDAKNFLRDRRWRDADGLPDPQEKPKPKPATSSVNGTERGFRHGQGDMFVSTPQSAKAALREGLINGWKENHPDKEPPQALLDDPIGYTTSAIKRLS